ncbi:MAG: DGQHR domain-containing protein [Candidatus Nanoarchaeia archaeon]|nr:DGQHR domain-containing protein [Candidatus Nanoarchaeia archaeon]
MKVEQNGNSFYIGKMKLGDLRKCATIFTRERSYDEKDYDALKKVSEIIENKNLIEKESKFGTQRRESMPRLKEIGEYIEKKGGFFPNNLIVSIDPIRNSSDLEEEYSQGEESLVTIKETYIEFDTHETQIKIIDGQHRFSGFRYIDDPKLLERLNSNFEFILTIFINIPYSDQADLFATINSTQKPVNKSILTDLKALSLKYKKLHVCNAITKWFNEKKDLSIKLWTHQINMLGIGEGIISQGMFVETISRLLTNDKDTHAGVLYNYYNKKQYDLIYGILKELFSAFERRFNLEWGNKNYLLCKTAGFIAIIKLFEYFYIDFISTRSKGTFESFVMDKIEIFKKNKIYDKEFFTKKNFGSSLSDSNKMKKLILSSIYSEEEILTLNRKIKEAKFKIEKNEN